jgi:hypothetical protein
MMNPHDARRALLADPRRLSPELELAIRDDAGLAALRRQLLDVNEKMASAFGEVVPMPGISERIILRARYRRRSKWLAGLAASALLVGALSATMLRREPQSALAVAMLDHVIGEPAELADNGLVSAAATRASLAKIGVAYADLGYRVRHIGECEVAGRIGRHLVMDTPQGVVTFLVMPSKAGELARRSVLNKGLFQAVFVPQRKLAIGVIGDRQMNGPKLEAMMASMFAPLGDPI